MRDLVETCRDISLNDPLVRAGRKVTYLGDRVMGPAIRAEPVGAREKVRLEDRLQNQF
jgi:hypothetical protein